MRGKSIALLMLALGCGLVAAIGITQVLGKRDPDTSNSSRGMQTVLVASRDISMGSVIDPGDVKSESWPKEKIPDGSLSKLEDAEGRRVRGLIVAGEPIVDKKLRTKGFSDSSASWGIPKGYRVVSVKVDSVSSGSGLILPGDRVDILVSLERNPARDITDTGTVTILQDIRVFAVNNDVETDKEAEKDGKNKGVSVQTISLLVTPQQANKVTLASEMGRIRLVMRPREDDARAENTTANPMDLFGPSLIANRKKEQAPDANASAAGKNSFLDFLNQMKSPGGAKPAPAIASAPKELPPNTWIVRILQPDGVNELTLEEDRNPGSTKGGTWRMSNSGSVIAANGGGDKKNRPSAPKGDTTPAALPVPPGPPSDLKAPPATEPNSTTASADAQDAPQQGPKTPDPAGTGNQPSD
jgi:pilus assembly protein CpaB